MNPIQRRQQIFMALAAADRGYDLDEQRNERLRIEEAERLLSLFNQQLESAEISDEKREELLEKKASLEREIKEKKKICEFTDL